MSQRGLTILEACLGETTGEIITSTELTVKVMRGSRKNLKFHMVDIEIRVPDADTFALLLFVQPIF